MGEELDKKVRGIVGLYTFYKQQLTTPQRIALLTLWIEICIGKEEYEVAAALQGEMDKITRGEEDYILTPPISVIGIQNYAHPSLEEMKRRVVMSMSEKPKVERKKLKFVNYWGTGSFHFIKLKFGDFKFIFMNLGLEMK